MLPRVLSIAIPLSVYLSLVLVVWGVYRERARFDRWALVLAAVAFIVSLSIRSSTHLLFFDEDIYIQIASNLSHRPSAQLTLFGGPGDIQASAYYKEPAGFPVLLSLFFTITGTREGVAFVVARMLYALAVAAVYTLARSLVKGRAAAIAAALAFAAVPAVFAYSSSAGTDLAAALFATLGVIGIVSGNGMLAAAGLAMASQVRLEMIAIAPLMLLTMNVRAKWKLVLGALLIPEVLHIGWVFSVSKSLAAAEHVEAAFSPAYVLKNLIENARYLFDPRLFPIAVPVLAVLSFMRRLPARRVLVAWFVILFGVYLIFYAGSFNMNPRYSIQVTIPLIMLAAAAVENRIALAFLLLAVITAQIHTYQLPAFAQTLSADHAIALQFAERVGPRDVVIASEPEIFLNAGKHAINSLYATEQPERIRGLAGKFEKIYYYAGARTSVTDTGSWEADRKVKSGFELHLIDSREIGGFRISVYEVLL